MIAVSVVMPTYNRLHILKETVRRLLAQDFADGQYEVIVVDDRSDDGSYEWLCQQAEAEERLRAVKNPRKGRASARNTGIELARGEVICFLDDDMWVTPGFIQAHWRCHRQSSPELAVAVGKMQPWPGNQATAANLHWDSKLMRTDAQMAARETDLEPYYFCTGNVSLVRKALDRTGPFDEGFCTYSYEDSELGYRLSRAGFRLDYNADALAYHRTEIDIGEILGKEGARGASAVRLVRKIPEAAAHMSVPYEIPAVSSTRKHDDLAKRLCKAIYFWRPTGLLLEGLLKSTALVRWTRAALWLMDHAGYHRYGRAWRRAARQ